MISQEHACSEDEGTRNEDAQHTKRDKTKNKVVQGVDLHCKQDEESEVEMVQTCKEVCGCTSMKVWTAIASRRRDRDRPKKNWEGAN